ncbi:4Fe-4S dicluster domain-containing protein [Kluyvera genomosp. 1]|uniref:4Fe-4S dicluster domain-containing protein n=1 Tax=Kluyvera genomosp. 1 TaxID=2774053 RepID=UPI00092D68C3|nr:4Fe-4S dicluster domain-containing protein [Kluyvera genomosp. 1]
MTHFILADAGSCIGCRTCEVACALEHQTNSSDFSPRLTVLKLNALSVPVMCHQCGNAPCISACPVGALYLGDDRVEADSSRCIGCQSCVVACPFGVISISQRMEIVKCDLCAEREHGPACVEVCPTSALRKITAEDLMIMQQQRKRATVF